MVIVTIVTVLLVVEGKFVKLIRVVAVLYGM